MTARRALLALAVVLAPVLQIAGMVPHPELPDEAADTLALVAQDPGEWFWMHVLSASSAALSIVAVLALAALVRSRGAGLATAGATLGVLGGAALAIAFGAEAQLLSLAADPSLDREAMVALAELEGDSAAVSLLMAGFPLAGLGTILLMAGLLRSRAVPRWQPALVLAGMVLSFAAAPGSSIGPLLLLPALVGYAALAGQVLREPAVAEPDVRERTPVPA